MRCEHYLRVPAIGGDPIVVVEWMVAPGSPLTKATELVILETDKVTYSVEAEMDGVLKEIRAPNGSFVREGDILGVLEVDRLSDD
ncbi:MAG: lipoyl domain-containing protein [bacterium JZ-2024 1]